MIDPNRTAGDANTVYDGGGARPILTVTGALASGTAAATIVAAAAGLRAKLLGFNIFCNVWTADGNITFKDGAGGANLFQVGRVVGPGIGQRFWFDMGGNVIATGSVNTLLELNYNGTAGIVYSVIYYQAP